MLYEVITTAAGRMYDSGEPKKPYYALGFRYEIGEGQYRYQWFLKGTFSAGTEAAKSRGENVDIKPYQFVYSAIPTIHIFEYQDSDVITSYSIHYTKLYEYFMIQIIIVLLQLKIFKEFLLLIKLLRSYD